MPIEGRELTGVRKRSSCLGIWMRPRGGRKGIGMGLSKPGHQFVLIKIFSVYQINLAIELEQTMEDASGVRFGKMSSQFRLARRARRNCGLGSLGRGLF